MNKIVITPKEHENMKLVHELFHAPVKNIFTPQIWNKQCALMTNIRKKWNPTTFYEAALVINQLIHNPTTQSTGYELLQITANAFTPQREAKSNLDNPYKPTQMSIEDHIARLNQPESIARLSWDYAITQASLSDYLIGATILCRSSYLSNLYHQPFIPYEALLTPCESEGELLQEEEFYLEEELFPEEELFLEEDITDCEPFEGNWHTPPSTLSEHIDALSYEADTIPQSDSYDPLDLLQKLLILPACHYYNKFLT